MGGELSKRPIRKKKEKSSAQRSYDKIVSRRANKLNSKHRGSRNEVRTKGTPDRRTGQAWIGRVWMRAKSLGRGTKADTGAGEHIVAKRKMLSRVAKEGRLWSGEQR